MDDITSVGVVVIWLGLLWPVLVAFGFVLVVGPNFLHAGRFLGATIVGGYALLYLGSFILDAIMRLTMERRGIEAMESFVVIMDVAMLANYLAVLVLAYLLRRVFRKAPANNALERPRGDAG